MTTLQAAVTGVLAGGLAALMAAGLSVTWGILRVINLAHFGLILLGAYLTFELTTGRGLDPVATLLVTAPVLAALGALLQWTYDRLRVSEFHSLLLTFGLLVAIVQATSNVWSADYQRMSATVNPYATRALDLGPLALPVPTLLAFAVAVLLIGAADLALRRTFAGRALRASAQDRAVAAAFGVNHRAIATLLAGAAGATAAVAGTLYALANALTPAAAFDWFGTVFAVVILGGVGHLLGTLAAGLLVGGLSGVVSVVASPAAEPFVLFTLIVLALLARPHGLFGRAGAV
jgi:branched-chain amino acid transport system permease protein